MKDIVLERMQKEISNKDKLAYASQHPEIEDWLRQKKDKLSPLKHLMSYIQATDYTPSELLDLKGMTEGRNNQAIILLEKFIETYKTQRGFSVQLHSIVKWVKSFYGFYGFTIPRQRAKCQYQRQREKTVWDKEDLLKFTENQSKRLRAMVSFESSCPCRVETLSKLNWSHVKEALDEKIEHPFINIEPSIMKGEGYGQDIHQVSFLHSWSRKLLLEWKEEYQELTHKQIVLSNPQSLNEPLWVEVNSPFSRLSKSRIEKLFMDRSAECGIKINVHSFRAFVNDGLRCNDDSKAPFLGHKSSYDGAYTMSKRATLLEYFIEAIPRINPIYQDKFSKEKKVLDEMLGNEVSEERKIAIAKKLSMGLVELQKLQESQTQTFMETFFNQLKDELPRDVMVESMKPRKKEEEKETKPMES